MFTFQIPPRGIWGKIKKSMQKKVKKGLYFNIHEVRLRKIIAEFRRHSEIAHLQYFLNHTPILMKLSKSDWGLQK